MAEDSAETWIVNERHTLMNTTERFRILVAEDNRVMGNVIRFNLERAGYEVVMAHDGRAALSRVSEETFDMVITDYQMPHASGDDLCRYVRFESGYKDIPVVLVSAKGMELQGDELVGPERFSRVVYKPFSPQEIVRIASELLPAVTPAA